MTRSLSVAYVKAHLASVLGGVARRGDRVTIQKRGKPIATLVPPEAVMPEGPKGFLALVGRFEDAPDFAEELSRIVRARRTQRKGRVAKLSR